MEGRKEVKILTFLNFYILLLFCLFRPQQYLQSAMVRAALVTATSMALTGAVVAHAYLLKHQFYPTVVYLTKSSPSMAVGQPSGRPVFSFCLCSREPLLKFFFLFPSLLGFVHSGVCAGVPAGEDHEKGVLWPAEGCRNGGGGSSKIRLYSTLPYMCYCAHIGVKLV